MLAAAPKRSEIKDKAIQLEGGRAKNFCVVYEKIP
jgi:hypothetical protein